MRNSDVLETTYHHRKTPGAFILTHHVFLLHSRCGHTSSRHWVSPYGIGSLVRIRVCGSPCVPFRTGIHTLWWTNREAFQVESPRRGRWYVSLQVSLSLTHHSFSLSLFNKILVRAPCPVMNTLANHDFVPHDGRNITMPVFVQACIDAFNISAAFCIDAFGAGIAASNPVPNSTVSSAHSMKNHSARLCCGNTMLRVRN